MPAPFLLFQDLEIKILSKDEIELAVAAYFDRRLAEATATDLNLSAFGKLGKQPQARLRIALESVDARSSGIVEEWIHLVEIPAPSRKEQARAEYVRAEMEKLHLADIRVDDVFNVSGVRKGTGGGPAVVFAAHTDTVFPEGTPLHVQRDGDTLTAPGIGDDAANLMATLEMFRALNRGGVSTKGDSVSRSVSLEEPDRAVVDLCRIMAHTFQET
jgi:hypothetical protein